MNIKSLLFSCSFICLSLFIHFNMVSIVHNFHFLYIKFAGLSKYGHLSPKVAKNQNYLYQNYLNQSPGQVAEMVLDLEQILA